MQRIDRADPPASLIALLDVEPDLTWGSDGIPDVIADIRTKLFAAQNGLCGYCERPLDLETVRIEHIHPRSVPPCDERPCSNHHYEWTNLLAVCRGNRTCDEAKADKDLCAELFFPDTVAPTGVFTVNSLTGGLAPLPTLTEIERLKAERTIEALNLDDIDLRQARRAALVEAQRRLMDEGEPPELIRFEMRRDGFPTAIKFVCDQLS